MEQREYTIMYQLEDNHWWFVAKRNFIRQYLKLIPSKTHRKILDIGCGTGKNLEMLTNYGKVQSVDYSISAIKFCYQRGFKNVKKATLPCLPFNSNSFDLVTLFDVLYHQGIKNDLQAIKEIFRLLKPGGYLLVTDCAHQFLFGPHDVAMHARQRYSKKELAQKIQKAGFTIKRSSYIYFFSFPIFLINRLFKKYLFKSSTSDLKSTPALINQLLIFIHRLEAKVLGIMPLPIGSSIIILAQK